MLFEVVPVPSTDDGSTFGCTHMTRPVELKHSLLQAYSMDDDEIRMGKGCFIQMCEVSKPVLRHVDGAQADPAARVV